MDNATAATLSALGAGEDALEKLAAYAALLTKWNSAYNLIGRSTENAIWRRHILDCAQLFPHIPPGTRTLIDFGSGAGLPGIVLAILGARDVHLIEGGGKKARFLREAARTLSLPVTVHHARIKDLRPWPGDVLTARALATMDRLLETMYPFLRAEGRCLLLKGKTAREELSEAEHAWRFDATLHPSLTSSPDEPGTIVVLEHVRRRT